MIKKQEAFHLKCITIILKIRFSDIMEVIKTNKEELNKFNIKYIANCVSRKLLSFISRMVRIKEDRVHVRLLPVF